MYVLQTVKISIYLTEIPESSLSRLSSVVHVYMIVNHRHAAINSF